MDTNKFLKSWVRNDLERIGERIEFWNNLAPDYGKGRTVSFSENSYLQWMESIIDFDSNMKVLDIGCGPGEYTMAIAEKVESVTGVDFSPEMIKRAKTDAEKKGIKNVTFLERDWMNCDLNEFEGKYDIVIAHTTPAVCDYKSLDKFCKSSKKHCFLCIHSFRNNNIYDDLCDIIGYERKQRSDTVGLTFLYAWENGYSPVIDYSDFSSAQDYDYEKTYELMTGRLERNVSLTDKNKEDIGKYLKSKCKNGTIHQESSRTLVNIYWEV